jgi:hypothetical protein
MSDRPVYDELPLEDEAGRSGIWNIVDRDGRLNTVDGMFLGMGSSHRPEHKGHPGEQYAPRGVHCSTCRWTEIRIFQDTSGRFCIVNCGASDVAGERDLVRVSSVATAFELAESLMTVDRRTRQKNLPMPARRALAQAASYNDALRDAYINSPVTRS